MRAEFRDPDLGSTGLVFRVAPNELSFASVESWKSIYGIPPPGQPHLEKSEFYDVFGAGFGEACIGSERDPQEHARKKKSLMAAFSSHAIYAQEPIVQHVWDSFVSKIGPASQGSPGGINIIKWLEMATFDALGEMAFGESFSCLENGKGSHSQLTSILHSKILGGRHSRAVSVMVLVLIRRTTIHRDISFLVQNYPREYVRTDAGGQFATASHTVWTLQLLAPFVHHSHTQNAKQP